MTSSPDSSSYVETLQEYFRERPSLGHRVLHYFISLERRFLLRSDLLDGLKTLSGQEGLEDVETTPVGRFIRRTQEAVIDGPWVYLAMRPSIARWHYLQINVQAMEAREVDVSEFLAFKERMVPGGDGKGEWALELDLGPFNREFYRLRESGSIGRGVEFLNRQLSSRLFDQIGKGDKRLLDFLSVHRYRDMQLMLDGSSTTDVAALRRALRQGVEQLSQVDPQTPWKELQYDLRMLGFEPGWGDTAERSKETMLLLLDILEAPSPSNLEAFLGRIPMIFAIAIVTPHGYFGQSNVLGRPDTGGQVVYILDQVRALEMEMYRRLNEQGLDIEPQIVVLSRLIPEADGTTCDQRLEPISGTRSARILRVPFKAADGEVIPHWISRFEIWPYLQRYAEDVEHELLAELSGRPDLIVGNYSDGNLVAYLLSRHLGVTQCNIAHALEKTKYLYSDLYWRDNEAHYHFSCQFTADLIAMNAADFIITSTYHEIAGTPESVGQYESYGSFTMPQLYRVVEGIDVFDPKFNIVSPGADPHVYFPYSETAQRLTHLHDELDQMVFGDHPTENIRGVLAEPHKPLMFTMARMDHIKNITGLVEWYGASEALRQEANLLVVSGHIDPARSSDAEEHFQIQRMHDLMNQFQLDGQVRWLGMQLEKGLTGELYRYVADRRGAFIQPALFEAFGLTVIEAMSSGLPVFATCFGGPLEIIEDGVSGFHIDPNHGEAAAARIAEFFARCREDPSYWQRLSDGALRRVEARYTWRRYAERMMTLSRVYGFWKYVTDLERAETRRYLEMFYGLEFRPLAEGMLS
jgi:sucrose synthase